MNSVCGHSLYQIRDIFRNCLAQIVTLAVMHVGLLGQSTHIAQTDSLRAVRIIDRENSFADSLACKYGVQTFTLIDFTRIQTVACYHFVMYRDTLQVWYSRYYNAKIRESMLNVSQREFVLPFATTSTGIIDDNEIKDWFRRRSSGWLECDSVVSCSENWGNKMFNSSSCGFYNLLMYYYSEVLFRDGCAERRNLCCRSFSGERDKCYMSKHLELLSKVRSKMYSKRTSKNKTRVVNR
jgi:hypothetical protein